MKQFSVAFLLLLIPIVYCSLFNKIQFTEETINDNGENTVDGEDNVISSAPPIVLYHGMGDTAHGSIGGLQNYLEDKLDGVYVLSIQMGNNAEEDFLNSYFMNINDQVEASCQILKSDPHLANGYNAMGFSQGGLIIRAIAQRCAEPKMLNLITFGGPHQGVYGLPRCPGENKTICDLVRKLINYGAYESFVQQHLVQAEYWHDPIQEELYKQKSVFLSDINNEITLNQQYKDRIINLKNFVMVMFMNDTILEPKESEIFGFYKPGQAKDVYTLRESQLYDEDRLGLKQLDSEGRLHLYEVPGEHLQIDMKWFLNEIVNKFLQ